MTYVDQQIRMYISHNFRSDHCTTYVCKDIRMLQTLCTLLYYRMNSPAVVYMMCIKYVSKLDK